LNSGSPSANEGAEDMQTQNSRIFLKKDMKSMWPARPGLQYNIRLADRRGQDPVNHVSIPWT
jgi:hypothetical protein